MGALSRFGPWACVGTISAACVIGCTTLLGDYRVVEDTTEASTSDATVGDAASSDSEFDARPMGIEMETGSDAEVSRLETGTDAAGERSFDAGEMSDTGSDQSSMEAGADAGADAPSDAAEAGADGDASTSSSCDASSCPCTPLGATQPCNEHPGKDGVGICRAGSQTCRASGWSTCAGYVDPLGRDCSSALDNDCDGRPDNQIDSSCRCAPGASAPCNTHPGKDGVGPCRAGSQSCVLAAPPSTSTYGACGGDVAPATDDCQANGVDSDCDGIKGNGPGCTANVYVYGSQPYNCNGGSSQWPTDLYIVDETDPAGVPNGYSLIVTMKLFVGGGGTKTAIYRCNNPTSGYHFVGFSGCGSGATTDRLVGYASTINGGNGWVQLAGFFGQNFGPTSVMPSDNVACCAANCSANMYYTLR
jgi:hypothetical protein